MHPEPTTAPERIWTVNGVTAIGRQRIHSIMLIGLMALLLLAEVAIA